MLATKNKQTKNHDLFKLSGIDINSRVNKIYLPTSSSQHETRSIHKEKHTNSYSFNVAQQMSQLVNVDQARGWSQEQYRAATRNLFSDLRQELRAGKIGLNKNYRPGATKW